MIPMPNRITNLFCKTFRGKERTSEGTQVSLDLHLEYIYGRNKWSRSTGHNNSTGSETIVTLVELKGDYLLSHEECNLDVTLCCGQAFRWEKNKENTWIGVVGYSIIYLRRNKKRIYWKIKTLNGIEAGKTEKLILEYLNLKLEINTIQDRLSKDKLIKKILPHSQGLRILKQDPWETLISFMLSANNNIPRICGIIANLCETWGQHLDGPYWSFPLPGTLSKATDNELRATGMGYRAPYILEAAQTIATGKLNLEELQNQNYEKARETLIKLKGVGPKIADCTCLFGLGHLEAFPVDVWTKRILQWGYFENTPISEKKATEFGRKRFGDIAGYAQEHLFYYARNYMSKEK